MFERKKSKIYVFILRGIKKAPGSATDASLVSAAAATATHHVSSRRERARSQNVQGEKGVVFDHLHRKDVEAPLKRSPNAAHP